jgi:hypothetical protein
MSSLSGPALGGDKAPVEEEKGGGASEGSPPASRKRGRLKGSHNKKTLEVVAAKAAAAPSSSAAPQATEAPGDAGVPVRRGPGRPKGSRKKSTPTAADAPSSSLRRGRPLGSKNKKAPAVFKVAATPTRPCAATSPPLGSSRPWLEKPALQPPTYISAQGWFTCIIPALAGSRDLLRLPSQFTDLMKGQEMAYAKLREYSGGQPSYHI